MKNSTLALIAALSMLLVSCSSNNKKPAARQAKFVTGSTNNQLEVLDWGGEGRTILFLAGMGNTAHVFNEFAPRFTDKFHVLALTRRGFGKSLPSEGYDLTALTGDILAVLDSLHIEKVILAGHSIAGEEITKFAGLYPNRIDKIVYIDAAYNRKGMDSLLKDPPVPPPPTTEDSASVENLQKYYIAVSGVTMSTEEINETSIFSKGGRYVKDVTDYSIVGAIIAATVIPEYAKIKCPALGIYAVYSSAADALPFYATLDSANTLTADRMFRIFNQGGIDSRKTFKAEVQNSVVAEIKGGNHYLFISNADETEKLMREFL